MKVYFNPILYGVLIMMSSDCNDWRYDPDPSQYSQFDYGYMNGPLGFSWGINWAKW